MSNDSLITSSKKDAYHITSNWDYLKPLINGVKTKEVKNIITRNSHTTELFRVDWGIFPYPIEQIINVALHSQALSAWHMHKIKTDHIFVTQGTIKVVLFDNRQESTTKGQIDVFHLSLLRPTLLIIPPGIWHGVQNLASEASAFINFFDKQYDYKEPDEYRLDYNTNEIPYKF